MCEIFYAQNPNGLTKKQIRALTDKAIDSTWLNPDGFGVFNDRGLVFKLPYKLTNKHSKKIVNGFRGSKFVIIHTRNATSGQNNLNNTHPFFYKGYLMVHNGVVYNDHDFNETDSYKMLRDIIDNKAEHIKDKILNVSEKTSGFLSIFLYNLKQKQLLYFIRDACFRFGYDTKNNTMYGMTNQERMKNLNKCRKLGKPNIEEIHPNQALYYLDEFNNILYITQIPDAVKDRTGYYGYDDYGYTRCFNQTWMKDLEEADQRAIKQEIDEGYTNEDSEEEDYRDSQDKERWLSEKYMFPH